MPAQNNQPEIKPRTLKTLLAWKAPERHFKKRTREYFTTIGAIIFLIGVILLFLQEWLLIVVMVALVFVAYILSTVTPREVEHQLTNRGIVTGGRRYYWEQLGRFWFSERWDQEALIVETFFGLPGRLILLLGEFKKDQVKKILSEYLLFEEPEKTWIDNASDWISRRVPLESSS
ncbi:hypothetical protein A2Z41_02690 [Microgenomates group bacterium RBG_19FT_COMBO_39_10]|nr:MAG: hypothetical protein A2Z41_02690 [Microgenomates group bacterium RBG_19FT_COMBO_39_10]